MSDLLHLFLGTLWLRPYVFGFLAVYLLAASRDVGLRRALVFTGWGSVVAFLAAYSSTRTGIPFGLYHYTQVTRGQEFYVANVPIMDSLSFTFLAYASFSLARRVLARSRGVRVVLLSGILMMLLDVVIDPLAVRGDRWFLGRIFFYPEGGGYFGVPLSNFVGWAVVGWAVVGGYLLLGRSDPAPDPRRLRAGVALYYATLGFNLLVTWWIGELVLLAAGLLLHAAVSGALWYCGVIRERPVLSGLQRACWFLARGAAGPRPITEPSALQRRRGGFGRGAEPPLRAGS